MQKFGFGLMRLPTVDGQYTQIDIPAFQEMADAFIKAGGTYFDTAWPYHGGNSERAFKEVVVKRYPRDSFTITDKMPMYAVNTTDDLPKIFNEQLERCGVEYFDYYWLHALGSGNYEKAQQTNAFDFIARMKAEGKIKHIGFSFHDDAGLLERILTDHPEVEYVQIQLNYLDWDDPTVQSGKCYEVCRKHGKPVMVMEPIKGGSLASIPEEADQILKEQRPELSTASWAIRFAASQENVKIVLSGMSNMEQMKDNLSYMKDFQPLNEAENTALQKATEIIRASIAVPCTACRYCVSEAKCPKNIAIPDVFAIYNNLKRFSGPQGMVAATYYANLTESHGKAGDCIGSGQCEKHCPQHLPIRDYLRQVSAEMDK